MIWNLVWFSPVNLKDKAEVVQTASKQLYYILKQKPEYSKASMIKQKHSVQHPISNKQGKKEGNMTLGGRNKHNQPRWLELSERSTEAGLHMFEAEAQETRPSQNF